MLTNKSSSRSSWIGILIGLAGIGIGLIAGFLAGASPILLGLPIFAVLVVVWFFGKFEQAVIGLLVLRSSLDIFAAQQLPAAFAIGLNILTLLYVTVSLLTGQRVKVDQFWWFFAGWLALQALWVVLLPLGGLGLDGTHLQTAVREWLRLFSWSMVYLLVMQLKDRIHPQKMISALFLSLVLPLTAALLQTILPPSLLPAFLTKADPSALQNLETLSRINGTLGHPNTFSTFLLFFIGLTCWQLQQSRRRSFWLLLLGILVFFLVSTKTLIALVMTFILIFVLISPKLTPLNFIGGLLFFAVVIGLYASTEFGRERLASIANTPLLNPDIDISRSILLSASDGNSFNWRITQWTSLLKAWQYSPMLGYGLGTSSAVGYFPNYAHNDYIRALVEGGIVGLMAFITFLIANILRLTQVLRSSAKNISQKNLSLVLIAILIALIVGMITENIWSHTTLFFYWLTTSAIVNWDWQENQSNYY
ncbi:MULTISPECIES: O-antigen ligase [unclassified Anabaena]|uniref:O-antigen ligase family protein n=1 Tax=unclassified Anabaena TaxID=2619674 RepID=UPI0008354F99|nr:MULTISPECIES: O-antigen ligase family protein [unclassified Anabaena]